VRAALIVQAPLGNAQPLYRPPAHQVFLHDLRGILGLHIAVPDGIGVHHHRGAVLALIQAAGLVDPHPFAKTSLIGQFLQLGMQIAFAVGGAGLARRVGRASVEADKDVVFECGQVTILLGGCNSRIKPQRRGRDSRRRVSLNLFPGGGGVLPAKHKRFPEAHPAPICENESLTMRTDNLLSLKDDMVAFIEGHGLQRLPGYITEDIPSILWEGRGNPDAWKDFVEMAKRVGAPFVTFSEMTLDREELDALIEEAGEMNFPDEEATELVEAKWLRKYTGMLGYIQLGFIYQGLVFLHESTTEWYERYQDLLENLESFQDIVIDDAHSHDDEDE